MKDKRITGIMLYGVQRCIIERKVENAPHIFETRTYKIPLHNKEFAYRRIQRLMKMLELDIKNKWDWHFSQNNTIE